MCLESLGEAGCRPKRLPHIDDLAVVVEQVHRVLFRKVDDAGFFLLIGSGRCSPYNLVGLHSAFRSQ